MQYSVPQFIDIEDKVFGPLTVKQFIYIIVAVMTLFLLYLFVGLSFIFIILAIPIMLVFGALAFLKVNGRPFQYFFFSFLNFFLKGSRIWVWRRTVSVQTLKVKQSKEEKEEPKADQKSHIFPKTRIQKITEILDSGISTKADVDEQTVRLAQRMRVKQKEL